MLGLTEALGERDGDALAEGEVEADGEDDALGETEEDADTPPPAAAIISNATAFHCASLVPPASKLMEVAPAEATVLYPASPDAFPARSHTVSVRSLEAGDPSWFQSTAPAKTIDPSALVVMNPVGVQLFVVLLFSPTFPTGEACCPVTT